MILAHKTLLCRLALACSLPGLPFVAQASPQDSDKIEFFESHIRPILAQDCYECHQTNGKQKGGLALDHRQAMLTGGNSGPAIIPGNPDASLLIKAIRHESDDLQMPKSGAPLERETIRDFETWIRDGAVDPRDQAPSGEKIAQSADWQAIMERRKNWWSFRPIARPAIPQLQNAPHPTHPVDAFIQHSLQTNGLSPSDKATKETLIRRLSLTLLGLPPSPQELEVFLADNQPDAFELKVDEYLNSPQFGERWARHWMDWVRYAESHGSEGDPTIPNAWLYRDYLIRALNQDVPYDQLLLEHLAGDLLPSPRINNSLGLNESAIGPAQLRMVFHGFAPTDALEELVRFTDDQINVTSKAFQGITVSCARCHDHKFDPISQKDFYAWYGIMASGRPAMIQASYPDLHETAIRSELQNLKNQIKEKLVLAWRTAASDLNRLLSNPPESLIQRIQASKKGELLWPLAQWINDPSKGLTEWRAFQAEFKSQLNDDSVHLKAIQYWDFANTQTISEWFPDGPGITQHASSGTWTLAPSGDSIVQNILPSGSYSHIQTTQDRGLLHSKNIQLDAPYDLWLLIKGDGNAMARYAVQNYPRNGTVYPVETMNDSRWRWRKFPLDYWQGDQIHIELTTAADQPVLARLNQTRSWFGIRRATLLPSGTPMPDAVSTEIFAPIIDSLKDSLPVSKSDLIKAYQTAIQKSLEAWDNHSISDSQALLLNEAVQEGLLPNGSENTLPVQSLLHQWRELESRIKPPVRVPGQFETEGYDQVLFERGNHKKPLDAVPRRFLEFLDANPYDTPISGRMELAQDMLRNDNPLTARVIVNRLWHHLFGKGIVSTPDNFGRLGRSPSHPELLDYLASHFKDTGWSIKAFIRFLVMSDTWQQSSQVSELSAVKDPENQLWSHFSIRRLEAETIRDNLLAVSGKLDIQSMYGEPVSGNNPRRSVYVRVNRNNLDPFLTLFDAPVPASTRGRRDTTNVPGQSLSMLNDPFVIDCSEAFAASTAITENEKKQPTRDRVQSMFVKALGRFPTLSETIQSEQFLIRMGQLNTQLQDGNQALNQQAHQLKNQLESLETSARERALKKRGVSSLPQIQPGPQPLASWNFSSGAKDQTGSLDLTMMGEAMIKDGLLTLNGNASYAKSNPIQKNITEKTLEAWVLLENLNQRGGGVISLQDHSGTVFDAIVFAEQESRKWLAGSNGFQRTQSMKGPEEQNAHEELVHVAMVYQADGTIRAYRNGQLYGQPYKSSGPVVFKSGQAHLIFGNRHGSPGGNRLLMGGIAKARFYDRALSEEEIQASFSEDPNYVSIKELKSELDPQEAKRHFALKAEIRLIQQQLTESKNKTGLSSPWADLAHALFNLKEFIYVQ